jgi:hypothetical protein
VYMNIKPLALALIAAGILSACGGGGGGGSPAVSDGNTTTPGGNTTTPGGNTTTPGGSTTIPAAVAGTTVMSCPGGATVQCSGSSILRVDNDVALTSSGVQVYGTSTNDIDKLPTWSKTTASGFALPAAGVAPGIAEVRLDKGTNGHVSTATLMLNNFGLSWDGVKERPRIVERFLNTTGRVVYDETTGNVSIVALPASSDTSFYNFATLGPTNATQGNYANNSYFPRTAPSRCEGGTCNSSLTTGSVTDNSGAVATYTGAVSDWRTGGDIIDWMSAGRNHEDGDVHAGDGLGQPAGSGVPFPGSKGYRELTNYAYNNVNLGTWVSQDTVLIEEWARQGNEHNKNRRGILAFGNVTPSANIPATGTVTYRGIVHGWYADRRESDPETFRGQATLTVNFATRETTLTFADTKTYNAAATTVPVSLTTTAWTGAGGTNVANYFTGRVSSGGLTGGVSGRYFGPVVNTGTTGSGPEEAGGAFRLTNAAGAAFVGGFIGRKQ